MTEETVEQKTLHRMKNLTQRLEGDPACEIVARAEAINRLYHDATLCAHTGYRTYLMMRTTDGGMVRATFEKISPARVSEMEAIAKAHDE